MSDKIFTEKLLIKKLAFVLWDHGKRYSFGDNSERNWQMAEWVVSDAEFVECCRKYCEARIHGVSITVLDQMIVKTARALFRLSLNLFDPSEDSSVNYHTAKRILLDDYLRDSIIIFGDSNL